VGLTKQYRIQILLVLAVLSLLVAGASFGYSAANPYTYTGEVPPDQETYPPVITITSPGNNTAYNSSRVPLTFKVNAPQSRTASSSMVTGVTYEVDWKKEPINVLNGGQEQASFNLQLSNIPEGRHIIVIRVVGNGLYKQDEVSYKWFFIRSTATICFTIDRTAPTVLVLSPENVSSTSAIPLKLTVNEVYSKIAYSLNGQQNVTVTGNSTIPHLPSGMHNLTFYVWDIAGNIGTSETANFSVAEIPKTAGGADDFLLLPTAAALSTVVIVGIVLLFKRLRIASR
jgi:hypothetical protein